MFLNGRRGPDQTLASSHQAVPESVRIARIEQAHTQMIKEFGFIVEAVMDDPETPFGYNVHTHGLSAKFNHPDLQIVFPMDPRIAHMILTNAANLIKAGSHFNDGDISEDLLADNVKTKFISAIECGRQVLRIILPDTKFCLEKDQMEQEYAKQFEKLLESK